MSATLEAPLTEPKKKPIRPYTPVSSARLRVGDRLAAGFAITSSIVIVLLMAGIIQQLVVHSIPALKHLGFSFFWSSTWNPVEERFGVLPYLFGTLVSSILALLIAAPFGIGTALFLTELAPKRLRMPIAFVVDMLAAIPSVVYGLWGIFVLAPFIQDVAAPVLNKYLGWTPLFSGTPNGFSMLTAGIILAIMIVPFITAISREVLKTVPPDLRAASLALGATHWETIWKVVLPYSRVGISGGIVLAMGRALGETMAVTMVIGNVPQITASLLRPGHSMSAVIANEFREADSNLYLSAVVAIGLTLFLVTLVINGFARLLIWRMRDVSQH